MVSHPAHCVDAAHAVVWVQQNAARFGGDPNCIHVMGHSAGAHIASMLAVEPAFLRSAGAAAPVQSFICVSGVYSRTLLDGGSGPARTCTWFRRGWYLQAAFGEDPTKWDAAFPVGVLQKAQTNAPSPLSAETPSAYLLSKVVVNPVSTAGSGSVAGSEKETTKPPILLINAQSDLGLQVDTASLLPLLLEAGYEAKSIEIRGVDHLSIYFGFGVPGSAVERELVPHVLAWLAITRK